MAVEGRGQATPPKLPLLKLEDEGLNLRLACERGPIGADLSGTQRRAYIHPLSAGTLSVGIQQSSPAPAASAAGVDSMPCAGGKGAARNQAPQRSHLCSLRPLRSVPTSPKYRADCALISRRR